MRHVFTHFYSTDTFLGCWVRSFVSFNASSLQPMKAERKKHLKDEKSIQIWKLTKKNVNRVDDNVYNVRLLWKTQFYIQNKSKLKNVYTIKDFKTY